MTTAAPSTALATIQPAFAGAERLALAGFLAGYRGLTRDAYALDLRQFTIWCRTCSLALFAVRRADIEGFARELEARGRARANGLRVSEATGADIEHLGLERGHRTLTITRKGGKVVTIPLAPRTARAIDLAIGERTDGPVFLAADGRRLDRHGAGRIVRRTARGAGIGKAVTPPTRSGMPSSPPPWMPGYRCGTSKRRRRTRIRAPRCGMTAPEAVWTGTPPASSPPTSQAPPGNAPAGISFARRSAAGRS